MGTFYGEVNSQGGILLSETRVRHEPVMIVTTSCIDFIYSSSLHLAFHRLTWDSCNCNRDTHWATPGEDMSERICRRGSVHRAESGSKFYREPVAPDKCGQKQAPVGFTMRLSRLICPAFNLCQMYFQTAWVWKPERLFLFDTSFTTEVQKS